LLSYLKLQSNFVNFGHQNISLYIPTRDEFELEFSGSSRAKL
jgi:hypothetical protein